MLTRWLAKRARRTSQTARQSFMRPLIPPFSLKFSRSSFLIKSVGFLLQFYIYLLVTQLMFIPVVKLCPHFITDYENIVKHTELLWMMYYMLRYELSGEVNVSFVCPVLHTGDIFDMVIKLLSSLFYCLRSVDFRSPSVFSARNKNFFILLISTKDWKYSVRTLKVSISGKCRRLVFLWKNFTFIYYGDNYLAGWFH